MRSKMTINKEQAFEDLVNDYKNSYVEWLKLEHKEVISGFEIAAIEAALADVLIDNFAIRYTSGELGKKDVKKLVDSIFGGFLKRIKDKKLKNITIMKAH